jgi:hypothetical protein
MFLIDEKLFTAKELFLQGNVDRSIWLLVKVTIILMLVGYRYTSFALCLISIFLLF